MGLIHVYIYIYEGVSLTNVCDRKNRKSCHSKTLRHLHFTQNKTWQGICLHRYNIHTYIHTNRPQICSTKTNKPSTIYSSTTNCKYNLAKVYKVHSNFPQNHWHICFLPTIYEPYRR